MIRPLLLVALLSLILLGGVREPAPVGAQEIITATGSMSEATAAEMGQSEGMSLQSSHIELSFPAEGGDVTGEWSVLLNIDLGPTDEEGGVCIHTLTSTGRLQGRYDGGSALHGTTTWTSSASIVSGCENVNISFTGGTDDWSGTFVGRQVEVAFDSSEFPLDFIATVAPPPEDGAPPDAAEDGGGDQDGAVFLDAGQDALDDPVTRAISLVLLNAQRLADCGPDYRSGDAFVRCTGLVEALNAGTRIRPRFLDAVGVVDATVATDREQKVAIILAMAASQAAAPGRDGAPLYPSVRLAMPVITELSFRAVQDDAAYRAVGRFLQLLAARDQSSWEKRFP